MKRTDFILIVQNESYSLSRWDFVLGWEYIVTNECVPIFCTVRQADKNIPCQQAAWRGEDSVQMRQTTSMCLLFTGSSFWRVLLLLFLRYGSVGSRLTSVQQHHYAGTYPLQPALCSFCESLVECGCHHDYVVMNRAGDKKKERRKRGEDPEAIMLELKDTELIENGRSPQTRIHLSWKQWGYSRYLSKLWEHCFRQTATLHRSWAYIALNTQ